MGTIHFRIDDETKQLAMLAAARLRISLTELMRQRAEELAEEERKYQQDTHTQWLENQVQEAFSRYDAGEEEFISHQDANNHMAMLKVQAAQGKL